MKKLKPKLMALILFFTISWINPVFAQLEGFESITAEELKFHLRFLAADEFRGRDTPSQELKIVSRYIALTAEKYGLKPLMPNGSYLQEIPLEITNFSQTKSYIGFTTGISQQKFFSLRPSAPGED